MWRHLAVVALALVLVPSAGAWTWPVDGPVLRDFRLGDDPYAGGQHRGIDIGSTPGSPVRAAAGGVVTFAGTVPGGGKTVSIRTADGYSVTHLQLGSIAVEKGATLEEGARVGTIGLSGDPQQPDPHVHLGVRIAADPHGYVDPLVLLPPPALPVPPDDAGTPDGVPVAEESVAPEPDASQASVVVVPEAPEPAAESSVGAPAVAAEATQSPSILPPPAAWLPLPVVPQPEAVAAPDLQSGPVAPVVAEPQEDRPAPVQAEPATGLTDPVVPSAPLAERIEPGPAELAAVPGKSPAPVVAESSSAAPPVTTRAAAVGSLYGGAHSASAPAAPLVDGVQLPPGFRRVTGGAVETGDATVEPGQRLATGQRSPRFAPHARAVAQPMLASTPPAGPQHRGVDVEGSPVDAAVPRASDPIDRLRWFLLLTLCLLVPPTAGAWARLRRRGHAPSDGGAERKASLPLEALDEAAPMMFGPGSVLEGAAGGGAWTSTHSGRRRVAVRLGPAPHRACGRVRRPVRRVRALSPAARERRAHGLGHRRARDAGHGGGGRRGTLVP